MITTFLIQCAACQLPITGAWKRGDDDRIVHADPAACGTVTGCEASAAITLQVSLLCDKDTLPSDREVIAAMTFGLVSLGYTPSEILITGHEVQSGSCCPRCHSTERRKPGRISMGTYACYDEWHVIPEELQPVPDGGPK